MCHTCGCNVTPGNAHVLSAAGTTSKVITVLEDLLTANNHQAEHNRQHFQEHGVLAINLMSAPGAGKTRLLEATIARLQGEFSLLVIEGDLETENDAQRIRAKGVPAIQITTGTACHLDAHLLHQALHQVSLEQVDIVFIENVGNLVCPASFDLGQHYNLVLLSVPEGDDKPAKYPVMFRAADIMMITKTDLLPYLTDFQPERAIQAMQQLANPAPIWLVSDREPASLDTWIAWLRTQLHALRQQPLPHAHAHAHPHTHP